jgi:hypothetical protein
MPGLCLGYNQRMDSDTPDADGTDAHAQVLAWLAAHPYGDQDENGVDLSLLRENLKLTPRERLAKLQRLLHTIPKGAHVTHRSRSHS